MYVVASTSVPRDACIDANTLACLDTAITSGWGSCNTTTMEVGTIANIVVVWQRACTSTDDCATRNWMDRSCAEGLMSFVPTTAAMSFDAVQQASTNAVVLSGSVQQASTTAAMSIDAVQRHSTTNFQIHNYNLMRFAIRTLTHRYYS